MLRFTVPLVLASASPRRARLLEQLGVDFVVRPSGADETWPEHLDSGPAVEELARRKCVGVEASANVIVLAADTVVVLDGVVLGKPATADEAFSTLRRLSGREHRVYTGIALRAGADVALAHACTRVSFAALSDDEIWAYVATGSPMDKAGAYGIQDEAGAILVSRIDGEYTNVVGLPVRTLYDLARSAFPHLVLGA